MPALKYRDGSGPAVTKLSKLRATVNSTVGSRLTSALSPAVAFGSFFSINSDGSWFADLAKTVALGGVLLSGASAGAERLVSGEVSALAKQIGGVDRQLKDLDRVNKALAEELVTARKAVEKATADADTARKGVELLRKEVKEESYRRYRTLATAIPLGEIAEEVKVGGGYAERLKALGIELDPSARLVAERVVAVGEAMKVAEKRETEATESLKMRGELLKASQARASELAASKSELLKLKARSAVWAKLLGRIRGASNVVTVGGAGVAAAAGEYMRQANVEAGREEYSQRLTLSLVPLLSQLGFTRERDIAAVIRVASREAVDGSVMTVLTLLSQQRLYPGADKVLRVCTMAASGRVSPVAAAAGAVSAKATTAAEAELAVLAIERGMRAAVVDKSYQVLVDHALSDYRNVANPLLAPLGLSRFGDAYADPAQALRDKELAGAAPMPIIPSQPQRVP